MTSLLFIAAATAPRLASLARTSTISRPKKAKLETGQALLTSLFKKQSNPPNLQTPSPPAAEDENDGTTTSKPSSSATASSSVDRDVLQVEEVLSNDSDTDSDIIHDSNTESETEEADVPQTHPGSKEPMPVSENVTAKTIKRIRKY